MVYKRRLGRLMDLFQSLEKALAGWYSCCYRSQPYHGHLAAIFTQTLFFLLACFVSVGKSFLVLQARYVDPQAKNMCVKIKQASNMENVTYLLFLSSVDATWFLCMGSLKFQLISVKVLILIHIGRFCPNCSPWHGICSKVQFSSAYSGTIISLEDAAPLDFFALNSSLRTSIFLFLAS